VELRGAQRPDDGNLIGDLRKVRKKLGDLRARLMPFLERIGGTQELGHAFDEGKALALEEFLRHVLSVEFLKLRLEVEKIDLRWRPSHEEINHALGLGRKMRRPGRQWIRGRDGLRTNARSSTRYRIAVKQCGKRRATDAEASLAEEVAPRYSLQEFLHAGVIRISHRSLFLRYGFIQVQQHVGNHCPGGKLGSLRRRAILRLGYPACGLFVLPEPGQLLTIERQEAIQFLPVRPPRRAKAESIGGAPGWIRPGFFRHPFCQRPGSLEKRGIVESCQSLKGSIRTDTSRRAEFPCGGIEIR